MADDARIEVILCNVNRKVLMTADDNLRKNCNLVVVKYVLKRKKNKSWH